MRATGFASLVALAVLSACGSDAPAGLQPTGRIRFVNLIALGQLQPVNATLDGRAFGAFIPFGGSSPLWLPPPRTANYMAVRAGDHSLVLKWSSDTATVVGFYELTVGESEERTYYATGGGGFTLEETQDDNTPPQPGSLRLRVVNMSVVAGPVDVFVTSPTADLVTATANVVGVFPRTASDYFALAPGTYRVRAVRAGVAPASRATNVVMNLNDQLWERGGRSIVVADLTSSTGVTFPTGLVLSDQ
jgi:hypothetical protein